MTTANPAPSPRQPGMIKPAMPMQPQQPASSLIAAKPLIDEILKLGRSANRR